MLQPLPIAVAATLALHSALGAPRAPAWAAWTLGTAPFVLVPALAAFAAARCADKLDTSGDILWIRRAHRALGAANTTIAACFAAAVLWAGWLDAVRGALGDWVLLDEAIAAIPPLFGAAMVWGAARPIDTRLAHAILLRDLDAGRTHHPVPAQLAYTLRHFRRKAAPILIPAAAVLAWNEAAIFGINALAQRGKLPTSIGPNVLAGGAQTIGGVVALVLTPLAVAWVWRAVPIREHELGGIIDDTVQSAGIGRQRILVWPTDGRIINAAALGFVPGARAILLTDALLERLPAHAVQAVLAHELGHIRFAHTRWLAGAAMAGLLAYGAVEQALLSAGAREESVLGFAAVGLAMGLAGVGGVSRIFERQADAFAARCICAGETSSTITREAAATVEDALGRVCRANHAPLTKWTWRHGSTIQRQRALRNLVGRSVHAIPQDKAARRVKQCITGATAAAIAGIMLL